MSCVLWVTSVFPSRRLIIHLLGNVSSFRVVEQLSYSSESPMTQIVILSVGYLSLATTADVAIRKIPFPASVFVDIFVASWMRSMHRSILSSIMAGLPGAANPPTYGSGARYRPWSFIELFTSYQIISSRHHH